MEGVEVGAHAVVKGAIIDRRVNIPPRARIVVNSEHAVCETVDPAAECIRTNYPVRVSLPIEAWPRPFPASRG